MKSLDRRSLMYGTQLPNIVQQSRVCDDLSQLLAWFSAWTHTKCNRDVHVTQIAETETSTNFYETTPRRGVVLSALYLFVIIVISNYIARQYIIDQFQIVPDVSILLPCIVVRVYFLGVINNGFAACNITTVRFTCQKSDTRIRVTFTVLCDFNKSMSQTL